MFALADGCWVSLKKDGLANSGGFLALRSDEHLDTFHSQLIINYGYVTYGGMSSRDMEAAAVGIQEVLEESYLAYRVGQVAYLAKSLASLGVPVLLPPGGHAVYIDAEEMLAPHVIKLHLPAVALRAELYLQGGIRTSNIDSVAMAFQNPETEEWTYPKMELLRIAIPRRTYTQSHLDYIVEIFRRIIQDKDMLCGFEIVYSPKKCARHFMAKYKKLL